MKTFSSIFPFANRLGLRRATCITSDAQGGGEPDMGTDEMCQRGLAHCEKGERAKAAQRRSDAFPLFFLCLRRLCLAVLGLLSLAAVGGCDAQHNYIIRAYNGLMHSPVVRAGMPEWLRQECTRRGKENGVFREVKADGYYMHSNQPTCSSPYPSYGCYQDLMGGGFAFVEHNRNEYAIREARREAREKMQAVKPVEDDGRVWRYSVEKVGHPDCAEYMKHRASIIQPAPGFKTSQEYLIWRNVDPDFEQDHCIAIREIPEITARYEVGGGSEWGPLEELKGISVRLRSIERYVKDRQTGEYVSYYGKHRYSYHLNEETHHVTDGFGGLDGRNDWCPNDFSTEKVYRNGLSPLNATGAAQERRQ